MARPPSGVTIGYGLRTAEGGYATEGRGAAAARVPRFSLWRKDLGGAGTASRLPGLIEEGGRARFGSAILSSAPGGDSRFIERLLDRH